MVSDHVGDGPAGEGSRHVHGKIPGERRSGDRRLQGWDSPTSALVATVSTGVLWTERQWEAGLRVLGCHSELQSFREQEGRVVWRQHEGKRGGSQVPL